MCIGTGCEAMVRVESSRPYLMQSNPSIRAKEFGQTVRSCLWNTCRRQAMPRCKAGLGNLHAMYLAFYRCIVGLDAVNSKLWPRVTQERWQAPAPCKSSCRSSMTGTSSFLSERASFTMSINAHPTRHNALRLSPNRSCTLP